MDATTIWDALANPANKRPRNEPSNSNSHASAAGKGEAKVMSDWAGPKLAEVAANLFKKAAHLHMSIQSNKEAIAKLQEFSAQEKTPSSLTLKLAPAAVKLLPHVAGVAEQIKQIEKGLMEEALRRRKADELKDKADLSSITSGDQFESDARTATSFDSLSSAAQALLQPLIIDAKKEFLLTMQLSDLDMTAKLEKQNAAKAARAAAKEARDMEHDQMPTGEVLKTIVETQVAKEMAKQMAKLRKQGNLAARRTVHFEHKPSRSNSRVRGRSQSNSRSQSRDTNRGRASGRPFTPPRGRSRRTPKPRGRSATPRPQRRQPSSSRSKSRENSKGGRGARPHRSPSAKRGGRERNVDGRGSRMGAHR